MLQISSHIGFITWKPSKCSWVGKLHLTKSSHWDFKNKVVVPNVPSKGESYVDDDPHETNSSDDEPTQDDTLEDYIDPLVKSTSGRSPYNIRSLGRYLVDVYIRCRMVSVEPSTYINARKSPKLVEVIDVEKEMIKKKGIWDLVLTLHETNVIGV